MINVAKGYPTSILFLYLSLVYTACTFDPQGEYFVDVDENPTIAVRVDLNTAQDTISLIEPTTFSYSIDVGQRTLNSLEIWLGDYLIETSTENFGDFSLRPENYQTGAYELRLLFNANSGTGSLADELGAQILTGERVWLIQIDNDPIAPILIQEVKPDNGRLLIKWNTYEKPNFYQYSIHRNNASTPFAIIDDQLQTFVYDSLYVGGNVTYRVDIQGYKQRSQGTVFTYSDNYPQLKVAANDRVSTVTLRWDESMYHANFGSYTLFKLENSSPPTLIKTLTNVNDTSITIDNVHFGGPIRFKLITSAHPTPFSGAEGTSVSVVMGQPFHAFTELQYVPQNQSYYLQRWDSIFRFDEQVLTSPAAALGIDSQSSGFFNRLSISEDGQYAYLNEVGTITELDPMTLSLGVKYPVEDLLGYTVSPLRLMVSNQNQLSFRSAYIVPGGVRADSTWYIDMNKGAAVLSLADTRVTCLSKSGKYLSSRTQVFQLKAGKKDTLGAIPPAHRQWFVGEEPEELLLLQREAQENETRFTWLRLPDLTTTRERSVPYWLDNVSVDEFHNVIAGVGTIEEEPTYLFFELNTGRLLKTMPIAPDARSSVYFLNKTLFSTDGTYMVVDI